MKRITDDSFKTLRAEDVDSTSNTIKHNKLLSIANQKFWIKS